MRKLIDENGEADLIDYFGYRAGNKKKNDADDSNDTVTQHKNDFIAFDLNQDSFVDASEVRRHFEGLSQEDISAFFIASDKDEDGLVTFEEYLAASLRHDEGNLDLNDYKFQWEDQR